MDNMATPEREPAARGAFADQSVEPSSLTSCRNQKGALTEADPDERRFRFTRFKDLYDTTPRPRTMSWRRFCDELEESEESPNKEATALWSPAIYASGAERGNEGVEAIGLLVFDVDHVLLDDALQLLGGYEQAIYTTYSHTPEDPRCRVVLPLSREVATDEWEEFWRRAAFWLAPAADTACKDVSRFYFVPSHPPRTSPHFERRRGRLLDPDELRPIPEDSASFDPPEATEVTGARPGDRYAVENDWAEILERYGWELVRAKDSVRFWRCPASDKPRGGHCAATGHGGRDYLYVFCNAEGTPFRSKTPYGKFSAYALLEHNGDFHGAARALAERYGMIDVRQGKQAGKASQEDEDAARALKALGDAVDTAVMLSDFAPAVKRLLNRRQGRRHKESLADTLAAWAIRHGRLLVADDGDGLKRSVFLVDDDGAVIPLVDRSQRIEDALARVGINGSEAPFTWTMKRLRTAAANDGARRVKLEQYVACRDRRLYISCGPTKIVVAEADLSLRTVRNGTDGVLFQGDAVFPVWDPEAAPVDPLTLTVLQPNLETPPEVPEYTPDAQRLLLRAMLISMIAGQRPLPAVLAVGSSDGGKTSLMRGIVRLFLGGDADVCDAQGDARDFNALISSLPLVAIDNLDGVPPIWLHDTLATAVTGARVGRRILYTDAEIAARKITATLLITSRTATFAKRNDIMERLFPLFVNSPRRRRADSELYGELAQARDGALVWLAITAAEALARSVAAPDTLPGRFVDWARTAWSLASELGPMALEAMARAQQLSIVDADELGLAIVTHVREHGEVEGTPSEIVKLVDPCHDLQWFGGAKAIGRRLRELAKGYLPRAGVRCGERTSGNARIWSFSLAATPPRASVSGETENLEILHNSEGKLDVEGLAEPRSTQEEWRVGSETCSTFSVPPQGSVDKSAQPLAAWANGNGREADGPYATETDRRTASLPPNAPAWLAQADWKTRERRLSNLSLEARRQFD